MKSMSYDMRIEDPFCDNYKLLYSQTVSPYTIGLNLMWSKMRKAIIKSFPKSSNKIINIDDCLKDIEIRYKIDAYNSLSIEGYKVTDELIEKVKSGN